MIGWKNQMLILATFLDLWQMPKSLTELAL
jgi:hypothetical protein